jgi:NAD-dependent DNA ligase
MTKNIEDILSIASIERDFKILKGILEGIKSDEIINLEEVNLLRQWVISVKPYQFRQPYYDLIELINEITSNELATTQDIEDILWFVNSNKKYRNYYNLNTKNTQELIGLLNGIMADKIINDKEIKYLRNWLNLNSNLEGTFPYDEVKRVFFNINEEKIFDYLNDLLNLFKENIEEGKPYSNNNNILEYLQENISKENVQFENKRFCVTGKSSKYSRDTIENCILERGGLISGISKKLDYLVICNEKSLGWTMGIYGKKIERIIGLAKENHLIKVITEDHLLNS